MLDDDHTNRPQTREENPLETERSAYVTEYTSRVWIDTMVKEKNAFLHCNVNQYWSVDDLNVKYIRFKYEVKGEDS